jgi:hypothetical protein
MISPSLAFAIAAGTIASSTATPPFPPTHGSSGLERPSIDAVMYGYETQAKALQTEMAALKTSDGGELTAQHRAYLRQKLIALLEAYRNEVQQVAPLSVNADGSPGR